MNTEKINSQMKKGVLEMCILAIISEEDVYTSDIIEKLKTKNLIVVEGTLYPLLTRLKKSGILDYYWVESPSGPPRKYFKLTETGKEFYRELHQSWNELVQAVSNITSKN
ncbi:MAG: PadR family transcriptional regulator [Saprospirales bacterium]|nr:MAG: PadR family transcriptional regulator [Saprospirales bacterium]